MRKGIPVRGGTISNRAVSWLQNFYPQIRLSLRITSAGLLAYGLCRLFGLSQTYQAVLTAVVVMQGSVGASMKAVLDRFFGSLSGALWAVVVLFVFRQMYSLHTIVVLAIALLPVALLSAFKPAYRAAPATAIILLLIPASIDGTLAPAALRMFGVGLGSAAALIIAMLVFPTRVHGTFAEAAGRALTEMSALFTILITAISKPVESQTIQNLHDNIRRSLNEAESVADEVSREQVALLATGPDPQPMCRTLRRIRNDLAMIGRVTSERFPEWIREGLSGPSESAGSAVAEFLAECGKAISQRRSSPSFENCERNLKQLESAITKLRWIDRARELSDEDVGRLFGFVFTLEQLNRNLKDLVNRIAEMTAVRE